MIDLSRTARVAVRVAVLVVFNLCLVVVAKAAPSGPSPAPCAFLDCIRQTRALLKGNPSISAEKRAIDQALKSAEHSWSAANPMDRSAKISPPAGHGSQEELQLAIQSLNMADDILAQYPEDKKKLKGNPRNQIEIVLKMLQEPAKVDFFATAYGLLQTLLNNKEIESNLQFSSAGHAGTVRQQLEQAQHALDRAYQLKTGAQLSPVPCPSEANLAGCLADAQKAIQEALQAAGTETTPADSTANNPQSAKALHTALDSLGYIIAGTPPPPSPPKRTVMDRLKPFLLPTSLALNLLVILLLVWVWKKPLAEAQALGRKNSERLVELEKNEDDFEKQQKALELEAPATSRSEPKAKPAAVKVRTEPASSTAYSDEPAPPASSATVPTVPDDQPSQRPEPAPPAKSVPSGDPWKDYNTAREMDPSLGESWFFDYYTDHIRLSCSNLELRKLPNVVLRFEHSVYGVFLAIRNGDHYSVFPLLGDNYLAMKKSLEGVFTYPEQTAETLRLKKPAHVAKSPQGDFSLNHAGVIERA